MNAFEQGELKIDVAVLEDGTLELQWQGSSSERDPGVGLRPFFQRVLEQAAGGSNKVSVRFECLRFFNSSTVAVVLRFIEDARARGVHLDVFYDDAKRWQRTSFTALRAAIHRDGSIAVHAIDEAQRTLTPNPARR